jgi:hypothetical protein
MPAPCTPVVFKRGDRVLYSVDLDITRNLDEAIKCFAKHEKILVEDWQFLQNNTPVNQHRTIHQCKGLGKEVEIRVAPKRKRDRFDNERKRKEELRQAEALCEYKCDQLFERVQDNEDLYAMRTLHHEQIEWCKENMHDETKQERAKKMSAGFEAQLRSTNYLIDKGKKQELHLTQELNDAIAYRTARRARVGLVQFSQYRNVFGYETDSDSDSDDA